MVEVRISPHVLERMLERREDVSYPIKIILGILCKGTWLSMLNSIIVIYKDDCLYLKMTRTGILVVTTYTTSSEMVYSWRLAIDSHRYRRMHSPTEFEVGNPSW